MTFARREPGLLARALVRLLLRLQPSRLRTRHGADLERDLLRLAAERPDGGLVDAGRFWLALFRDLAHARSEPLRYRLGAGTLARRDALQPRLSRRPDMGSLLLDLRSVLRSLRRSPLFAAVVVTTLALGIGATTAMLSLVRATLIDPLPFAEAERLVVLHEEFRRTEPIEFPFNATDYLDFLEIQEVFEEVGAFQGRVYELSGSGSPERIRGLRVTPDLLPMLGIEPARGRSFTAAEDRPESGVVVLSGSFWRTHFGGATEILGATVQLDRKPHTVIGVLPERAVFPLPRMPYHDEPAQVFLPMGFTETERDGRGMMHNLTVLARLPDGSTLDGARAALEPVAAGILERYPGDRPDGLRFSIPADGLREVLVGDVRRPLLLLLGAMALVLLLVCTNVASLVLSRGLARASEVGVRAALGAGWRRLLQLHLLESIALALLGTVGGLVLARAALHWITGALPGVLPLDRGLSLGLLGVAAALVLALLIALALALLPMIGHGRRVESGVQPAARGALGDRRVLRTQQGMVVATVALAVILLLGAALLLRSFSRILDSDPGFDPTGTLVGAFTLPVDAYPEAPQVRSFVRRAQERLAAVPGARSASLTTALPLDGTERRGFAATNRENPDDLFSVRVTWVAGPFFRTHRIDLENGRVFDETDREDSQPVAVVNRRFARRVWGDRDPLGEELRWGLGTTMPGMRVVGVVDDVNDAPLGAEPVPQVYVPYDQIATFEIDLGRRTRSSWGRAFWFAVAAETEPGALSASVRETLRELDPSLAVTQVSTMEQRVASGVEVQRLSSLMVGGLATVALLLALIGLYGVLAYGVSQRRREIGVRLALGARRGAVVGRFVARGLALALVGLVAGLAASFAAGRYLSSVLYETSAHDPLIMALVGLALLGAAAAASLLPAWRAGRVDPAEALQPE